MAKKEHLPVVRIKRDALPVVRLEPRRSNQHVVVKAMTPLEMIGGLQDSISSLRNTIGHLEKRVREVEARLVRSGA